MRKRGIEDFSQVQVDGWAVGEVDRARRGPRLLRGVAYLKGGQTNFYGRPIEGVVALVNMNTQQVIEVVDAGIVPMPPASQELTPEAIKPREAPKPLAIVQPEGPGFQIDGHQVSWQKWRFRYSLHPREGLVLHTVGYEDDGRLRPILYRVSLSEMAVPYGDPGRNWRWRSAFDVGEYNVGLLASSIEPGTDAPDNATLLDATVADEKGGPSVLKRVVGIYERDGGLLWKHYDLYSKVNQSRRARQLVIFFIATIGNYDYAINYVFHQDGVLEVDAALSGIMLPKGVASTKVEAHAGPQTGHLVAANVVAPNHQHFFNFRLDFAYDVSCKLLSVIFTVALAVSLRSYWALVYGQVAAAALRVIISFVIAPEWPKFTMSHRRAVWSYSQWSLAKGAATYAVQNGDRIVLGRLTGAAEVGAYSMAREIAEMPLTEISMPVNRALGPGFSALQDDPNRLVHALTKSLAAVAILAFPIGIGLGGVVFFNEHFTPTELLGSGLILAGIRLHCDS
jgi:hypothetical protein